MNGGWIDDFTSGWGDATPVPAPPPPPAAARLQARRVIITALGCPKCPSLDVRCTKRTTILSYWRCPTCGCTWQEAPEVGGNRVTPA